jgi:hypothetical protein
MEYYGLLAADYVDLITGDFTMELPALCILHWVEEYCEFFLMGNGHEICLMFIRQKFSV